MGEALTLGRLLVTDELFQVLNQVVELCDLDEVLNDVAWVEEADRLNILFNCFVVLFLLKQFIRVLFDNLALDLSREVCLLRYGLRLCIMGLLH